MVKSTRGLNGLSVKSYKGTEDINELREIKHKKDLLGSDGSLMIFAQGVEVLVGELGDTYAAAVTDSYRPALEDDANSDIEISNDYAHEK